MYIKSNWEEREMLKTLSIYSMLFLFLFCSFHVDLHQPSYPDGYSICDTHCDDNDHHFSIEQCIKCLAKTSALNFKERHGHVFFKDAKNLFSYTDTIISQTFLFYLYSRPPPNIL